MRTLWLKALLVIAAIWLVIGGVIWAVRASKPTPESMVRYVAAHPVDGRSGAQREKVVHAVADQLNALEYEQRRELQANRRLESFFKSLNKDEQNEFLDLTLPAGMRQMMEVFNKMKPEERKKIVDRAMVQIKQHAVDEVEPGRDDAYVAKIIEHGLQSFYTDASADTKLDLAPLIEQIQKNLQGIGQ